MDDQEIIKQLNILGLAPGVDHDEIKKTFRKLVREYHPDISGNKNLYKFRQISGAYAILRNLTPEDLSSLPEQDSNENFINQIDYLLDHYENLIFNFSDHDKNINEIIYRLNSDNPGVINLALRRVGNFADDNEIIKAIIKILKNPNLNNETAKLISLLNFSDLNRRKIVNEIFYNSKNFPLSLILNLSGSDYDLLEKFLIHANSNNIAPILRRWPNNKNLENETIRILLSSDDENILIPVLSFLKLHFPKVLSLHYKRIDELKKHNSPVVRAWTK